MRTHAYRATGTVRDVVIGMADGLTVLFALAGPSAAVSDTSVIVTAGLAEIAAGAIANGLGVRGPYSGSMRCITRSR